MAKSMQLSKPAVLRAAVDLADAEGIEALTMRKLAGRLGVEAMSLYHHVGSKEQMLAGMVDSVFGEIELPGVEGEWQAAMRSRALSVRRALNRHPWAVGLMDSIPLPGPATLRHHNSVVGCLRRAGFSVPKAAHAFSVLDSYIYGFVLQEKSLPFESPEELARIAQGILHLMPAGEYPYLHELAVEHVLKEGYDYGAEFELGLDLVIGSLERMLNGGAR